MLKNIPDVRRTENRLGARTTTGGVGGGIATVGAVEKQTRRGRLKIQAIWCNRFFCAKRYLGKGDGEGNPTGLFGG